MWVLILCLYWGDGTAITKIEVETEELCNQAGKQWVSKINEMPTRQGEYICVKSGR